MEVRGLFGASKGPAQQGFSRCERKLLGDRLGRWQRSWQHSSCSPGGVRGSPDSCIATARQPSSDSTQSAGLLQKGGVSTWRSCSSSWCRMSPRRRPFVVNLSNHGGAAHIDSRAAVWVGVASAIVVVALSNALDLCDSLRSLAVSGLGRAGHSLTHACQRRPGGPRPSRISTRPTSWCAAREGVLARLAAGRGGRAMALARGAVVERLRDRVRRALPRHADVLDLLSAGPAIEDGESDERAKGVGRRADSERVEAGRRLVG